MKKIVSILVIALLVAMLATVAFAAEEPKIIINTIEAAAGDELILEVSIENNPGIYNGILEVEFDTDALEANMQKVAVDEDDDGEPIYANTVMVVGEDDILYDAIGNGMQIVFASTRSYKGDGVLFRIYLKVKADAKPGSYEVKLNVVELDLAKNSVATFVPGKVEIPCEHDQTEVKQENVVDATCKTEGSYDEVVYCSVCGEELSRDAKTIAKLAHTAAAAVKENEVAPTCTAEGSYDEVVYCSVCGEELSRDAKTIAKLAHTAAAAVKENEVAPTCTAEGSYDEVVYCSVCGEELSRVTKTVAMVDHTAAEAVKENIVGATCQVPGSYDEVVYCSVCGKELSRTHVDGQLADHVAGQTKKENEVAPTCTAAGSYDEVVYCSVCDKELSRNTVTVDALGHKPAAAVKENEVVGADCQTAGSYEEVVYCSVCGEELSREKKAGEVGAHKLVETVKEATCCEKGEKVVSCELCGHVESKEELAATGEHVLTYVDNNDGLTHKVICSNTGKELTAAEAHTYGEFIEDVENPGWKYQLCEKCGYKHVEEVPTGDNAMIAVAVATLSMMGVALVVSKKKEF